MSYRANGHRGDPFKERRATLEEHLNASANLQETAAVALSDGNLVLASEACWGVVAHMLQAIAERHGLSHWSNRDLDDIVSWLVGKTNDHGLRFPFACAYTLHRNFYRIVLVEDEVQDNARYAMDLVDRIREFADS